MFGRYIKEDKGDGIDESKRKRSIDQNPIYQDLLRFGQFGKGFIDYDCDILAYTDYFPTQGDE